jgi:trans-aconitate 2-methyltransferase
MAWDPGTYGEFGGERARPFVDLARRVEATHGRPGDVETAVDLGCGTGMLTAGLTEVWPKALVIGVDSSAEMLEVGRTAARQDISGGRLRLEEGDLREWRAVEPVDVIITNAALQWVPGHAELLPGLVRSLAPGGVLGLQVPGNHEAPSHALLRETVSDGPWARRLTDLVRGDPEGKPAVHTPSEYVDLLFDAGCDHVDAWETTYVHVLDPAGEHGADAVLLWVSGTALRPFLDALEDDGERQAFRDAYADRLSQAYPRRPYGTLLPFRRVFAVGRRAA